MKLQNTTASMEYVSYIEQKCGVSIQHKSAGYKFPATFLHPSKAE